jgi:vacuolar-type H+-ATPase subunit I/STV1
VTELVKSKSLLNAPSTKPKTKRSPRKAKTNDYLFSVGDTLVYLGTAIDGHCGSECKVISRSKTYIQEFYKIQFDDGEVLESISDVLRTIDDYEEELRQLENNQDSENEISEIELEVIRNGYEPYKNKMSCYSSLDFYYRNCNGCTHKNRCIYRGKFKYKKLDSK